MCETVPCTPARATSQPTLRTIDRFSSRKMLVSVQPVPGPERPSPDPTSSSSADVTAPPPVSPLPGKMPNPYQTWWRRPYRNQSQSSKYKKAKMYAFRKEWLGRFLQCSAFIAKSAAKVWLGTVIFAVGASTFRIETLKKHNVSNKHSLFCDRYTSNVLLQW